MPVRILPIVHRFGAGHLPCGALEDVGVGAHTVIDRVHEAVPARARLGTVHGMGGQFVAPVNLIFALANSISVVSIKDVLG